MLSAIINQQRVSFLVDGKPMEAFAPTVTAKTEGNKTVTKYTFAGGLVLTNTLRYYPAFDACDWVNEWQNTGDEPSGIISELWDCDVSLPFSPCTPKTTGRAYLGESENVIKVYSPRGSDWSEEEFFFDADKIKHNRHQGWLERVGDKKQYVTVGGRSADSTYAPFFNIKHGGKEEGYIVAVGWTGQWKAQVERGEDFVRFQSKIEDTHFRILPGEKFRTSSATVLSYRGSVQDGQNKWRRLIKEVYSPIRDLDDLPFASGLWGGMSTAGCLSRIAWVEKTKLPFNCYWMDAGWYGMGTQPSPDEYEGDWAQHTGDWRVNPTRHPDGLLDVASAIKATDKRYLLWFEPERVRKNMPIATEHPEYLIWPADEAFPEALMNLGNEQAWQYCFDTLCDFIEKFNLGIYRQDFNFHPISFWRSMDAPDRQGITEIKHISGLYRLWDALRERFPHLLIDNCASGGRRIDIETLRRSIPLWRSDSQCPANPNANMTQAHNAAYGSWMPYSGTGVGRMWLDTYRFRSGYAPALTTNFIFSENNDFETDPALFAWLEGMCAEYLRVKPYLCEDVYPLTGEGSANPSMWSAMQYHNPKTDEGVIQVFRREDSPYDRATLPLFGLQDDKEYVFEDVDEPDATFTADGKALLQQGFSLHIPKKRTAKLYFYKAK